jgi:methionyl-tRNA formyltransferase
LEALAQIENGSAARMPQDNALASYAPVLSKADGNIDWHQKTKAIVDHVRGFDPWPGAYSSIAGQTLKIWRCAGADEIFSCQKNLYAEPGAVIEASQRGVFVKTGDGAARVVEMQAGGGKRMAAAEYLRGREIKAGTMFSMEKNRL